MNLCIIYSFIYLLIFILNCLCVCLSGCFCFFVWGECFQDGSGFVSCQYIFSNEFPSFVYLRALCTHNVFVQLPICVVECLGGCVFRKCYCKCLNFSLFVSCTGVFESLSVFRILLCFTIPRSMTKNNKSA